MTTQDADVEQLRQRNSDLSFMAGERDILLAAIDKILDYDDGTKYIMGECAGIAGRAKEEWAALRSKKPAETIAAMPSPWRDISEATEDVIATAAYVRPKLGRSCTQAEMGWEGKRYAFIFDNPDTSKFVWLELPPPPGAG